MKIKKLKITDASPSVQHFEVDDLDQVVVIAGANGAGKTTIKRAICESFANPQSTRITAVIESTRPQEKKDWGHETMLLSNEGENNNNEITSYLNSRTKGGTYIGGIFQIDSRRDMQQVNFTQLTFNTQDPDDSDFGLGYHLSDFSGRWNNIVNNIYLKTAHRLRKLGELADKSSESHERNQQIDSYKQRYPEPILKYQQVVSSLFDYMTLETISIDSQREFTFTVNGSSGVPFQSLSSGEQEVIKIAFDIVHRDIRHCVVIIDEPELHLHPTLAFRLIETLKNLSEGSNQFFFFTHSADLISTYASSGNVYFVDTQDKTINQARRLSDLSNDHEVLASVIGDKLGLFAVGKKIIFVEGAGSSIDKLTYHSLLHSQGKNAVVVPIGGVYTFNYLSNIAKEITKQIYGIQFYFLRDRDGLTDAQITILKDAGVLCLNRRHLENYFLDPEVLAEVFKHFKVTDTSLEDPKAVKSVLDSIATELKNTVLLQRAKEYIQERSGLEIPTVKSVQEKSVDELQEEFIELLNASKSNLTAALDETTVKKELKSIIKSIDSDLNNGNWVNTFPGKVIYREITSHLGITKADIRARDVYIRFALNTKPEVFDDIITLFDKV